ncbi:hypothetical protein BHE74_00034192 [Ensete ventricosum]|uniref:Uncharacterized protein n=1 Tax=Ensete ventricosum TaxID=4639 RepID=A0A426ZCL0_ENSVE|nr:hypothetical protein B296_00019998 [Ensete ventricosum]RWW58906.1 hypothetical protein BHE74_00034192 [Ensete ventricosum]RZS20409.1 hypothetical protein BHM03_00052914 [Ensete ventricosum]
MCTESESTVKKRDQDWNKDCSVCDNRRRIQVVCLKDGSDGSNKFLSHNRAIIA